jgi:putative nucleotidyltransferase with HDIG domain
VNQSRSNAPPPAAAPEVSSPIAAPAVFPPDAIRRVWIYVSLVFAVGGTVLVYGLLHLHQVKLTPWLFVLSALTMASGRYRIKVPGHAASVSVPEVFIFGSVLLYGPIPAMLVGSLDGFLISRRQKTPRLYRTLFNVAEPALSISAAAYAFNAVRLAGWSDNGPSSLLLPGLMMAAVYFLANSTLIAAAVSLERAIPVAETWRKHAIYLAMNSCAAASIAVLVFATEGGLNVIGLIVPVVALSFAAYKAVVSRMEDADRHVNEVEGLYRATVETLAIAVDAKDQVTHGHIRRVQRHTVAVARTMGVSAPLELRALEAASLLHDVGKLAVPDYVLNKPGALTHAEFERMKQHAAKGAEILEAVDFPYAVVPIVRHHHEQWNGQGYPDGLAGEDIPFGARVLAVVDCFDAVTSDRPYRRKMSDVQGIDILRARRGTMYDPQIVDAFIALIPALRDEDRRIDPPPAALTPKNADGVTESEAGESQDAKASSIWPPGGSAADLAAPSAAAFTEQVRRLVPGAEGCYFTPDGDSGELAVTRATRALPPNVMSLRVPVGEGLAGWVAVNRHTIVNSHADLDLGDVAREVGLGFCTATPVFALGELRGVISVYLPAPRRFNDSEARAVGALAQMMGMTMAQQQFAIGTGVIADTQGADVNVKAS